MPKIQSNIFTYKHLKNARYGCFARFIPLSDKTGVKLWINKKEALYSLRKQRKAYSLGIAPRVLSGIINCVVIEKKKVYNEWGYKTQRANIRGRRSKQDVIRLRKKARLIGFSADDIDCGYNTGKIGKRAVLIDFGSENKCEDHNDFDEALYSRFLKGEVR